VQVKIRQADFSTCTRQCRLRPPGNGTETLYTTAIRLLDDWMAEFPGVRVRLLGVCGSELTPDVQPDLFAPQLPAGGSQLDQTLDEIREKFGNSSLARARALDSDQIR
jgi:DNA polymerase IV